MQAGMISAIHAQWKDNSLSFVQSHAPIIRDFVYLIPSPKMTKARPLWSQAISENNGFQVPVQFQYKPQSDHSPTSVSQCRALQKSGYSCSTYEVCLMCDEASRKLKVSCELWTCDRGNLLKPESLPSKMAWKWSVKRENEVKSELWAVICLINNEK